MGRINGQNVLQIVRTVGTGGGAILFTTTTDATLISGTTYELALTYLSGTPKIGDFIAYVNNGTITTLYKVTAVDSTNATLEKIGDIGRGKYQHNIHFKRVGTNATVYCEFQITNDKSNAYTLGTFKDLCYNNRILGTGNSSLTTAFKGIFTSYYYNDASNKSYNIYYGGYYSTSGAVVTDLSDATDSNTTIEDEVVAL